VPATAYQQQQLKRGKESGRDEAAISELLKQHNTLQNLLGLALELAGQPELEVEPWI